MAILIDEKTNYLIQGMTGKEGQRALGWMKGAGANVLAGVTPGKGGQEVDGVPVYNSVKEALEKHKEINATSIYVPPRFVFGAANEAMESGIKFVHIMAEGVPTKDTARLIETAKENEVRILGPSSIGIISPGKSIAGSMGGGDTSQFLFPYSEGVTVNKDKGGVVVLSKSGGMANTVANMLALSGIAQTTVIGLGGDRFIGTTYADLLSDIKYDKDSWGVVIIGEIGGSYEEDLARAITEMKFDKRVVAFVSGLFAQNLPQGVSFGHAGAIVSETVGTRDGKIKALKEAGVLIADKPEEITSLLKG